MGAAGACWIGESYGARHDDGEGGRVDIGGQGIKAARPNRVPKHSDKKIFVAETVFSSQRRFSIFDYMNTEMLFRRVFRRSDVFFFSVAWDRTCMSHPRRVTRPHDLSAFTERCR